MANKIFVTSDWHFNHNNILNFERTQFKTIKEHNEFIIAKYNECVGDNDTVYFLGDAGFGKLDVLSNYIHQLKGHKIWVLGNHDYVPKELEQQDLGFEKIISGPYYVPEYKGKVLLSHEPAKEAFNNPYVLNFHGHLHCSELALNNFINANVGLPKNNFCPIDLDTYKQKILSLKSREESFLTEWYAPFYHFINKESAVQNGVVFSEEGYIDFKESLKNYAMRKQRKEQQKREREGI